MNFNKESMETLKEAVNEREEKMILKSDVSRIVRGDAAYTLFDDPEFQEKWDALYSSCSWATAFQSRIFVASWYKIFKNKFYPIVVLSETEDGTLSGLLPMAARIENM